MQVAMGDIAGTETSTISKKKMRGQKGKKGFSFLAMMNKVRTQGAKIAGLGQKVTTTTKPTGLTPGLKPNTKNALELVDAQLPAVKLPKMLKKVGERTDIFVGLQGKLESALAEKTPTKGKKKKTAGTSPGLEVGPAAVMVGKQALKGKPKEGVTGAVSTTDAKAEKKAPVLKLSDKYKVVAEKAVAEGEVKAKGVRGAVVEQSVTVGNVKGKEMNLKAGTGGKAAVQTSIAAQKSALQAPIVQQQVAQQHIAQQIVGGSIDPKNLKGLTIARGKLALPEKASVAAAAPDVVTAKKLKAKVKSSLLQKGQAKGAETEHPAAAAAKEKGKVADPQQIKASTARAAEGKVVGSGVTEVKVAQSMEQVVQNPKAAKTALAGTVAQAGSAGKDGQAFARQDGHKGKAKLIEIDKAELMREMDKAPRPEKALPQTKATTTAPKAPPLFTSLLEQAAGERITRKAAPEPVTVDTAGVKSHTESVEQPQQINQPKPTEQPAQRFFRQVENGMRQAYVVRPKSVTVKLTPEDLGELKIRVTVEKEQVHAQIEAESRRVSSLLKDNAGELEHRLREKGIDLESLDISDKEEKQEQGQAGDNHAKWEEGREKARADAHRRVDEGEDGTDRREGEQQADAETPKVRIVEGESFSFTV